MGGHNVNQGKASADGLPQGSPALKPPLNRVEVERAEYERGCFACLCSATSFQKAALTVTLTCMSVIQRVAMREADE